MTFPPGSLFHQPSVNCLWSGDRAEREVGRTSQEAGVVGGGGQGCRAVHKRRGRGHAACEDYNLVSSAQPKADFSFPFKQLRWTSNSRSSCLYFPSIYNYRPEPHLAGSDRHPSPKGKNSEFKSSSSVCKNGARAKEMALVAKPDILS